MHLQLALPILLNRTLVDDLFPLDKLIAIVMGKTSRKQINFLNLRSNKNLYYFEGV